MYTSFGIHTFTLFITVVEHEAFTIIADFKKYNTMTGEILIIKDKEYPSNYAIEYRGGRGIRWRIKYSHEWHGIPIYCIEARLNPKVLSSGVPDYFNVANYQEIKVALDKFDTEAKKISDKLETLSSYKINRIDYCINFDIKELGIDCTVEEMTALLKRGNIPHHFKEWMKYDKKSHRMVSDIAAFYLISKSVVLNCYQKGEQLQREYPQTPKIPNDIIRFEIQCKYNKIFNMKKGRLLSNAETMNFLLSDEHSRDVITSYYNRIILGGDYYSLADAARKIQSYSFSTKKEERLIGVLKYIAVCRGIAKAKDKLHGDGIIVFSQALRELVELGINPVTIPREWGIKQTKNLLDSVNDVSQSRDTDNHMKLKNSNIMEYYNSDNIALIAN